ncbi:TNF receptor-associated factor 3 [Bagarius yarrelli]|uniref:TNF receptor-associated factor 3 n=1 Tax=Bagarius yarrelli TaxID=175774 RepID=A0A556UFE6_BAGYA|nr:TNF receptor-associated factor 3 [Bagarius yarrelli]
MPAMLEKGTTEISGKRRGRNSVSNPTKSFTSNGNSNNSWEEGSSPSSSDDEHGAGGMRVGPQFQAVVPDYDAEVAKASQERENLGMLVWIPNQSLSESKLDEYIAIAKEKHGYNMEQALGMLFWHKHNIEKSLADLPNFTPFPDEWTVEDKVLFEQGFSFHGKTFHRIQQMLPDKSIASLVRFYYSWKKTRSKTSVMDRHARKQKRDREESDEEADETSCISPGDTELESNKEEKKEPAPHPDKPAHIKKEAQGPRNHHRSKRKPPKGMHLNQSDVTAMSSSGPAAASVLRQLDMELIAIKRQIQSIKQVNSALREALETGIEDFRPSEVNQKFNTRWTTEEQLLAVQAIRKYGRDFQAISDVIGNKSVVQVKNFFVNYRRRFNLDEVLQEWEAEHGVETSKSSEEEKMEVSSEEGTTTPVPTEDQKEVMSLLHRVDGREQQIALQQSQQSFLPLRGGFQDHFVMPPEPKYCCEHCRMVLCNPRQTECGHRFCESCINQLLSKQNPVCPADMEPLSPDKIFRDVCCNREIMTLKVYCRSAKNGCKEQMSLQQVTDHLNMCEYFEVPCPLCKEKIMRKDVPEHLSRKCKYREATCEFCKHKMALTDLQLSIHQQDCPKAQVTCSFLRFGCTYKGLNQEMREHESNFASEHLRLMVARNNTLEAKVEDVKSELLERYKVLPGLSSRLTEVEEQYKDMREKYRQVEQKLSSMQKLMSTHSEKLLEVEMELRELRPLRAMREEVEALRGAVESLRSVVASLDSVRTGSGTHTLTTLETQLSRHDELLSVHDIRLADMDLKLQVLETASFNGTLIWKIHDYKRRKQEAVASKTLSLYSQPFYTGYFGYKMCARVYLNGDGMGKGTHLSLFFVVMRGEYDALLPWPFRQKVTLMLMDQGPARKHLGDAFKPDPNSSSFRRPTGEMNIASGCPLFVAQTVLENGTYIKDDTIFIKVTVDTSDLPDP